MNRRLATTCRRGAIVALLVEFHERILATSSSPSRLERSRRALDRMRREQGEEDERLRRINASLPPASTFEGQLQRRVREPHRDDGEELVTIWDGTRGGASLTSVNRS